MSMSAYSKRAMGRFSTFSVDLLYEQARASCSPDEARAAEETAGSARGAAGRRGTANYRSAATDATRAAGRPVAAPLCSPRGPMTLSDWGLAVGMLGTGAGALYTLQKFFAGLRPTPNGGKIQNGERASVLEALDRLQEFHRDHARRLVRYERALEDLENRLSDLENMGERRQPTRSAERRHTDRESDQPDTT